jgi:hypothetical protein
MGLPRTCSKIQNQRKKYFYVVVDVQTMKKEYVMEPIIKRKNMAVVEREKAKASVPVADRTAIYS